MNTPILFAAEHLFACHHQYQSSTWLKTYLKYPKSKTGYRFLNAGTFIGFVSEIKALFKTINILPTDICDQGIFSEFFVRQKHSIHLDYNQAIFSCNGGRGGLEKKDYLINNGKLYATKTQRFPKILHIPGKLWIPLDRISYQLGITRSLDESKDDLNVLNINKKANQKPDFFKIDHKLYFFIESCLIYASISILILSCIYAISKAF